MPSFTGIKCALCELRVEAGTDDDVEDFEMQQAALAGWVELSAARVPVGRMHGMSLPGEYLCPTHAECIPEAVRKAISEPSVARRVFRRVPLI